jgi:hypothetical protein
MIMCEITTTHSSNRRTNKIYKVAETQYFWINDWGNTIMSITTTNLNTFQDSSPHL